MKVFSHLYQEIISLENLFQAWEEFKKEKRKKLDVGYFERYLEDEIFRLHRELSNKTYRHSTYTGFYIRDPKVRHIHKAVVRDRIVHHALFKILNPIFEPTFISDSYSCRKGYGTHKGFKRLVSYARAVSKNYSNRSWALKCDISKFFDSVDHEVLLNLIKKKVKDSELLWLIEDIIKSYHTEIGKGIPIGNLTSQLFANIYLNELDQFVKHKIKAKYYLRYADDFILLNRKPEVLVKHKKVVKEYLEKELCLNLHPNKVFLRELSWGIDFVGYVARPYYQVIRNKTKRRIYRKLGEKVNLYQKGVIEINSLNQSIQSYLGILAHANTYKLEKDLKNKIWFWLGQS